MKKILEKILIVEDVEKNREAAEEAVKKYFSDYFKVDFAETYEQAIQKLEENIYVGAIVDLHFPRNSEEGPERIGLELGKELDVVNGRYRVPHVYLTGGYHHHGPQSKVFIDEVDAEKDIGYWTRDKSDPEAWKTAFEKLLEHCPYENMKEIVEAKERAQKYLGDDHKQEDV